MIVTTLKKRRGLMLLTLIISIGSVSPAHSEFLVKDYERIKEAKQFKLYLHGVGVGYSWANTALKRREQTKLYCVPTKLTLSAENYADILEKELRDNPKVYAADAPVEMALLYGLIETFPCK